jgi:hypothetical protein
LNLNDTLVSIIRTLIPSLVGLIISSLARIDIHLDSAALTVVADGLIIGLYYTIVRLLERWQPWFGWLLGMARQPAYGAVGEKV